MSVLQKSSTDMCLCWWMSIGYAPPWVFPFVVESLSGVRTDGLHIAEICGSGGGEGCGFGAQAGCAKVHRDESGLQRQLGLFA
mgnify:CR=1 FL=1